MHGGSGFAMHRVMLCMHSNQLVYY